MPEQPTRASAVHDSATIKSNSGISYGTRNLGEDAILNANEGLKGTEDARYEVIAAEEICYVFTIKDNEKSFSLIIGGGPRNKYNVPVCHCGSNKNGVACKVGLVQWFDELLADLQLQHIFWLWDQVLKTAFEREIRPRNVRWNFLRDGRLQSDERGQPRQDESIHRIIMAIDACRGLEDFAQARGWSHGRVSNEEDMKLDERMRRLFWAIQGSPTLRNFFWQTDPRPNEEENIFTDVVDKFGSLVKRYADHDANFRKSLDDLLDPQFADAADLVKMRIWEEELFERLENETHRDPITPEKCAVELRHLAIEMDKFWSTRQTMEQHCIFIAKLFIDMLKDVIDKNHKLCVYLIVQPEKDMFLLRELVTMPEEILVMFPEELSDIDKRLSKTVGAEPYREEFKNILSISLRRR